MASKWWTPTASYSRSRTRLSSTASNTSGAGLPSEIAESVIANTAEAEVTNILTRMIGREIDLTNQGFKVRQAADGFQNQRVLIEGKKKVIQVPDPDRARFFIEIFNLRAAGTFTDKQITDRVNAMGYRSRRQNRWNQAHETVIGSRGELPLTVKQLQSIITRPIYCGIICEKWTRYEPIRAQYDGLISIDIFNRANRGKVFIKDESGRLTISYGQNSRQAGRFRNNPLFPYKSLVLCPLCRKPFVASSPRGKSGDRFPTYHCSRKHKYVGIPKADFDRNFESFIKQIDLKPEIFETIGASFLNSYYDRKNEIVRSSVEIHKTIAELKAEQRAKSEAFVAATSPVMRATLEKQVEELETRIASANGQSRQIDIGEADIDRFRQYGEYFMEHLSELLLNGQNPLQQQNLLGLIFETFPTYEDILNGTPKLAQIFAISEKKHLKGVLVAPCCFDWNAIETTIKKWIYILSTVVILPRGP